MPKGGRGRGRAKGKGRAQLLADGESLRPARRPDMSLVSEQATAVGEDDSVFTEQQTSGDSEEKRVHKVPSGKEMVTEKAAGSLG